MLDSRLHDTQAEETATGHERWSAERCLSELARHVALAREFIAAIEAELRTGGLRA